MRKSIREQSFFSNNNSSGTWCAARSTNGFVQIIQQAEYKKKRSVASKVIPGLQKIFFSTPVIAGIAILAVLVIGCAFSYQLSSTSESSESSGYTVFRETMDPAGGGEIQSVAVTNDRILIDSIFADLGKGVSPISREKNINYTVQDGDTFFRIGMLYKIDTKTLKRYNKIDKNAVCKSGMNIIIPSQANLRIFKE